MNDDSAAALSVAIHGPSCCFCGPFFKLPGSREGSPIFLGSYKNSESFETTYGLQ